MSPTVKKPTVSTKPTTEAVPTTQTRPAAGKTPAASVKVTVPAKAKRSSTTPPVPVKRKAPSVAVESAVETEISVPVPRKRGPYNVSRVNKKALTFRLPQDVFDLIRAAQEEATARGNKLSNDEAVIQAVRSFWGSRRRRRG